MVKRINVIPYLMSVIAGALNFACSPELLNKEINFLCAVGVQTCEYKLFVARGSGADYGMAVYSLEHGTFKPLEREQFIGGATNPADVIHYPKLKSFYVLHQFAGGIRQYQYDDAGATSLVQTFSTGLVNPQYMTIDSTGNYLLVSELGGGTPGIYSYAINPTSGALTLQGSLATSYHNYLSRSPTTRYIAAGRSGGWSFGVFEVNAQTGIVSQVFAPSAAASETHGTSLFSPTGDKLYIVNVGTNQLVEVWSMANPASPTLLQEVSTPGVDYIIQWNASKTRIYALGGGYKRIHILDVDPETGLISSSRSQSISINSNNRIAFTADDSVAYLSHLNRLRAFKVDSSGLLSEAIYDENVTGIFFKLGQPVAFGE